MAQVIWSEPALSDLDAIADYIALDDRQAARKLVQRVFEHVEHLAEHPRMGSRPPEPQASRYRQIIEPPCRVLYRQKASAVLIVHVMRVEQFLSSPNLHRGS